jgi:hypothetical protein
VCKYYGQRPFIDGNEISNHGSHLLYFHPTRELVDNDAVGWDGFPVKYKVYPAPTGEYVVRMSEKLACLLKYFMDPAYWKSLIGYMSEEQEEGFETYNPSHGKLYKSLFQCEFQTTVSFFSSGFCLVFDWIERMPTAFGIRLYEVVKPLFEELVGAHDNKSKQRAAAELFSGVYDGAKLYAYEDWKKIMVSLNTIFFQCVPTMTPDTIVSWLMSIKMLLVCCSMGFGVSIAL